MKLKNRPIGFKKHAFGFITGLFRTLFIIGVCYLFIFPFLSMLINAFKPIEVATDPTAVWIPRGFSLAGIKGAAKEMKYGKSALLTLTFTLGGTVGSLVSCSLAGYGLARFRFPGKSVTLVLVILTIIVPPQVTYTSTYLLYRFFDFGGLLSLFGVSLNLLDTPWVFILPSIFASGLRNGIFILVFYSLFKGLPIEMEEAAKIDGCDVFKTFVKVMLPLAVPAFVTVMLFSIVWHWTDFQSTTIFFTDNAVKPLIVMLSKLQYNLAASGVIESVGSNYQAVNIFLQAGALLVVAPPVILYIFMQKHFTESIERTGLVG